MGHGAQHFQCQFDHCFGIGPGHQRFGRELQRQAPELLVAKNTCDRLAFEAAPCEILKTGSFIRGEKP